MLSSLADTTASFVEVGSVPSTDVSFMTAAESSAHSHLEHQHEHEHKLVDTRSSSRASSSMHDSHSEYAAVEFLRHVSPPPPDQQAQMARDERRYRMLLQHEFHPSRVCFPSLI